MPNELVNWRRSPAGAQGTNSGHKNAEGMAAVGVHVERPVRHLSCFRLYFGHCSQFPTALG